MSAARPSSLAAARVSLNSRMLPLTWRPLDLGGVGRVGGDLGVGVVQAEVARGRVHVLVAAPGQVDDDQPVLAQLLADLQRTRQGVGALDRGDDALRAREQAQGLHGRVVGDRAVLAAAAVLEVGVLGADARVVQTGRDRVRLGDLALLVLEDVGPRTVQDAGLARGQRGRVLAGLDAVPGGLAADEAYVRVGDEGVEEADGVRAAADAGDRRVGEASCALQDLAAGLDADHAVEVADHGREGCGPATVPKR